jgi:hypothetical protein
MIATTVLVLLAAACSSSPSSTGSGGSPDAGGSANTPSAVGYSRCMRSNGVPNFPDPTSSGGFLKGTAQQFGVSDSQLQAARQACQRLLPSSGGQTQAQVRQAMSALWNFARCMRSHGVPGWPDPSTDSEGDPIFYLQGEIDEHAPQIMTKIHACQRLIPPVDRVGGPPGGVPVCPGDRPGPDATSACGGPNQGG